MNYTKRKVSVIVLASSLVLMACGNVNQNNTNQGSDTLVNKESENFKKTEKDIYDGWVLKYEEDFSEDLKVDDAPWVRDDYGEDSPWYVDGELDGNGKFFHAKGGEDFERHLDSFWLMRKRTEFGEDDWLTAELATKDFSKTGQVEKPVTFDNITLPNGDKGAKLDEQDYGGGGLIRSTEPLPPEYRIEYKLKTVDFGGMRDGSFEYDGKINGIIPEGDKTNFPWKAAGSFEGPSDLSNPNFDDVKGENGFYFLTITDYPDPAPHNNIFIHTHRKVGMDAYNVNGLWSDSYLITNPETGDLYKYNSDKSTRNGINAFFMNGDEFKDHNMPYNDFLIETEAGSNEGDIISTAEIQPELMPDEDYTFAIEKDKTGYTMEMSGNFLYAGNRTLSYKRGFTEDDKPISHYNNRPDQYEGQYDNVWEDDDYKIENTWPEGSAYPDYFIIGDPHLTHYEGSATISDIKLFVPEEIDSDYIHTIVWQLNSAGEFTNEKVAEDLKKTLIESTEAEKAGEDKNVIKYMKEFETLLDDQKNKDLITEKAYEILKENAESVLKAY